MKTWYTVDKTYWTEGEWLNEPDKAQWINKSNQLDCLIVRNDIGALCGYVGIPPTHKYFKTDYSDINNLNVHGGLTFSGMCRASEDESVGICHIESLAANKIVWWLGFDCAHCCDRVPPTCSFISGVSGLEDSNSSYKTFAYVKNETESLAEQLTAYS